MNADENHKKKQCTSQYKFPSHPTQPNPTRTMRGHNRGQKLMLDNQYCPAQSWMTFASSVSELGISFPRCRRGQVKSLPWGQQKICLVCLDLLLEGCNSIVLIYFLFSTFVASPVISLPSLSFTINYSRTSFCAHLMFHQHEIDPSAKWKLEGVFLKRGVDWSFRDANSVNVNIPSPKNISPLLGYCYSSCVKNSFSEDAHYQICCTYVDLFNFIHITPCTLSVVYIRNCRRL